MRGAESDVPADDKVVRSRVTGGDDEHRGDAPSATGTGESGKYVGRVAGQDEGYDEETGAEVRAEE